MGKAASKPAGNGKNGPGSSDGELLTERQIRAIRGQSDGRSSSSAAATALNSLTGARVITSKKHVCSTAVNYEKRAHKFQSWAESSSNESAAAKAREKFLFHLVKELEYAADTGTYGGSASSSAAAAAGPSAPGAVGVAAGPQHHSVQELIEAGFGAETTGSSRGSGRGSSASSVYEETATSPTNSKAKVTRKKVRLRENLLRGRPPIRILDAGCGPGRDVRELTLAFEHPLQEVEVYGVDCSPGFVQQSREAVRKAYVEAAKTESGSSASGVSAPVRDNLEARPGERIVLGDFSQVGSTGSGANSISSQNPPVAPKKQFPHFEDAILIPFLKRNNPSDLHDLVTRAYDEGTAPVQADESQSQTDGDGDTQAENKPKLAQPLKVLQNLVLLSNYRKSLHGQLDGIFCLASLFHAKTSELPSILAKFWTLLRPRTGILLTTLPVGANLYTSEGYSKTDVVAGGGLLAALSCARRAAGAGSTGSADSVVSGARWKVSMPYEKQIRMVDAAGFELIEAFPLTIYNGLFCCIIAAKRAQRGASSISSAGSGGGRGSRPATRLDAILGRGGSSGGRNSGSSGGFQRNAAAAAQLSATGS